MTIFDKINNIPLEDIIKTIWIQYKKRWSELCLFENWKHTNWWRAECNRWIITAFSKERPYWDRISFVMRYYNLDKKQAVDWYKENFHLEDYLNPVQMNDTPKIDVRKKYNEFKPLSEDLQDYLKLRWIDYEKVKDVVVENNWMICSAIYDEFWEMISYNSRTVWEKSFRLLAGSRSDGVYMWDINKDIKKIYVVEWMFDFLTLRQYTKNVIGLKSKNDWLKVVRAMYESKYEIVLIPDNDEAGKEVVEKLSDIKYSLCDISLYGVKDINDLHNHNDVNNILEEIEATRTILKTNIDEAFDDLENIQKVVKERGKRWIDSPFKCIDMHTQWIIEGKVYTIWAFSNTGKSQLAYEYASYYIQQGKKVLFISTEVGKWDLLAYILRNYYRADYKKVIKWDININRDDFKNLFLYDNIHTFNGISEIVKEKQPDIVFIDYIQSIKHEWWGDYERMTNLAIDMQQLAIAEKTSIFSLSQVNNDSRNKDWTSITLKGSGALFAASDVIFWLSRVDWCLKLSIAKNKFGKAHINFDMSINFNNWSILIKECLLETDGNYNNNI